MPKKRRQKMPHLWARFFLPDEGRPAAKKPQKKIDPIRRLQPITIYFN